MPAKKNTKKTTPARRRNHQKTNERPAREQAFAAAPAQPMPGILFNQLDFKAAATPVLDTPLPKKNSSLSTLSIPNRTTTPYVSSPAFSAWQQEQRLARRWLYVGVGSIIVMILTLWSVTLRARFQTLTQTTNQPSLIAVGEKNWKEIFANNPTANTLTPTPSVQTQEQIKQILSGFVAHSTTNTTTHTSTTPAASPRSPSQP